MSYDKGVLSTLVSALWLNVDYHPNPASVLLWYLSGSHCLSHIVIIIMWYGKNIHGKVPWQTKAIFFSSYLQLSFVNLGRKYYRLIPLSLYEIWFWIYTVPLPFEEMMIFHFRELFGRKYFLFAFYSKGNGALLIQIKTEEAIILHAYVLPEYGVRIFQPIK